LFFQAFGNALGIKTQADGGLNDNMIAQQPGVIRQ
jgi:hypothetical protein